MKMSTVSDYFGSQVFDDRVMRATLSADVYASLRHTIDEGTELDIGVANAVAEAMNIACPRTAFTRAAALLAERGIDTVAHMIVGLPGEGKREALATLDFINRHPVRGIKIHSLYVTEGCALAEDLRKGDYTPLTLAEYADTVACLLAHARPDLVIHRLTGDPEKEILLAPLFCTEKHKVLAAITHLLCERGWYQGCLYT
jgi:radical SAM superfamily enzyme